MNHVGQFLSRILNLARTRFNASSTPKPENRVYKTTVESDKVPTSARKNVSSDHTNYTDYKTPALFASARRSARRFVKSSVPKIVSSLRQPKKKFRKEQLNTAFCVRKIDWDEVSVEADDDDDYEEQKFWSERRNNGTWHLDQISIMSPWKMEDDYNDSFSTIDKNRSLLSPFPTPMSAYETFLTPNRLFLGDSPLQSTPLRGSWKERTFLRTSSVLDICKTDQYQISPDPSLGKTYNIPSSPYTKRKLSLTQSLKNLLNSSESSLESNDQDNANDISADSWMSIDLLNLNPATQCSIFCSSKIDQDAEVDHADQDAEVDEADQVNQINKIQQVNKVDRIDEVDLSDHKSISRHDSGFGTRSSLVSNDTAVTNEWMNINWNKEEDDDEDKYIWKKGQAGIARWYSFTDSFACPSPLSNNA